MTLVSLQEPTAPSMNTDVWFKIASTLPLKALLKLSCTSKYFHWLKSEVLVRKLNTNELSLKYLSIQSLSKALPFLNSLHQSCSNLQRLQGKIVSNYDPSVASSYLRAFILKLPQLRDLEMEGLSSFENCDLETFATCTGLQSLRLSCCFNLTDASCAPLTSLTHLRAIGIETCPKLTDAALGHLAKCTNLRQLQLTKHHSGGEPFTETGVAQLTSLVALEALYIPMTHTAYAQLPRLTSLRQLIVYDFSLPKEALAHLVHMVALEFLFITRPWECGGNYTFGEAGLAHIARISSLRHLNLDSCKFLGEGLTPIVSMTALRSLTLKDNPVAKGKYWPPLGSLLSLEHLDVEDDWTFFSSLEGNKNDIAGNEISEELVHLTRLRSLKLGWCHGLTDRGLIRLCSLTGLRHLKIVAANLTDAGIEEFKRQLPRCSLDYDPNAAADFKTKLYAMVPQV